MSKREVPNCKGCRKAHGLWRRKPQERANTQKGLGVERTCGARKKEKPFFFKKKDGNKIF